MRGNRQPIIWSPEALQDLFDIWDHIWQSASATVADKQLHEINELCFELGRWPNYGKVRDDVREGLRSARVSRYVVFYRPTKKTIDVVRVLDGRRDVDTISSQEG